MSKSHKKHGVIKDKGWTEYNKKFRRVNKQKIHIGKEPIAMKELINVYDVCDYIFRWDGDLIEIKRFNDIYKHYYKSFNAYKRKHFKK